uniref:Peptidase S1 domain-containing protein n=1 Tax=Glossina palpalis gambiensis TaxID=67801 RepID=A0A1B0AYX9_9MUSC
MHNVANLLLVAVWVLTATRAKANISKTDGRIIGGTAVNISSFPWQVSLQRSGEHFCGGAVYNENTIITAAHCLQAVKISALKVRVGSSYWNSGGTLVAAAALKWHTSYDNLTQVNDVAIIRLATNLTFSSSVKPIELATVAPVDNAAAVVTGWGRTDVGKFSRPSELRAIHVNIVSRVKCSSSRYGHGLYVKPSMICTYASGKDHCYGDSGSPLVSGGLMVGIVSWGYGCALPDYPGVYADIADLREWIVKNAVTI